METGLFLKIYGFCGLSTINELANEGDLISKKIKNPNEKLKYARDIAKAVADLQSFDGENITTLIHRDLGPANVMLSDGRAKLNDFNAAIILKWDPIKKSPCTFTDEICGSDGRRSGEHFFLSFNYFFLWHVDWIFSIDTRSPEECLGNELNEKIDTYGMVGI